MLFPESHQFPFQIMRYLTKQWSDKLKSGSFTFGDVGSQLSNALAVGNYLYGTKNYMDIPVSPLRIGLLSLAQHYCFPLLPVAEEERGAIPEKLAQIVR